MQLKRLFSLLILGVLAGCGFKPVYSDKSIDQTDLSQITIAPIPDRMGQLLRNTLLDRGFGDADNGNGIKLIFADMGMSSVDLGLAPDNTATRRQLSIGGTLIVTQNGKTIAERKVSARSTYNVLVSQYGTIVSQQNAEKLAINDLANQIETHVVLLLGEQSQ